MMKDNRYDGMTIENIGTGNNKEEMESPEQQSNIKINKQGNNLNRDIRYHRG